MSSSLIRDPRIVPIEGADHHLPPIADLQLNLIALRQRFLRPPDWAPEFSGDGARISDRELKTAAVLVPLVQREHGLNVLLTRRADHLRDHAGQISFPGGRAEPWETDPAQTALREAQEEVGLPPESVEIIGRLPAYTTVTSYLVTPVVGLITPPLHLQIDPFEVAEAFEVPLRFLMTPAHHRRHRDQSERGARHFLSMPWHSVDAAGTEREYFIWGATAAMLRNLYRFLAA